MTAKRSLAALIIGIGSAITVAAAATPDVHQQARQAPSSTPPPICTTIAIPFTEQREASSVIYVDQTTVRQEGEAGEKKVCRDAQDTVVSETVTKQPVNRIISYGTKEYPVQTHDQYNGASAICEDGTLSYSQNRRGTCSHHGGVAEWL